MQAAERELIDQKFKGVFAMIESNQEINKIYHKELIDSQEKILAKASAANEGVEELEKQTRFFRWVERNPKTSIFLGVLLVAGFISIGTLIGWNTIANKLLI